MGNLSQAAKKAWITRRDKQKRKSKPIYGHVTGKQDITKINQRIRREIRKAKSREELTKLVQRSQYLRTLTASPGWKNIDGKLRPKADEEYLKTCKLANRIARQRGLGKPNYGPD